MGWPQPGKVRKDCRYYLRYANRDYCKWDWYHGKIEADPRELRLGCDAREPEGSMVECQNYSFASWRIVKEE